MDTNKLRHIKDIDPDESVTISLDDPRIMDLLNTCNPSMNTRFEILTEDDREMLKRLKFQNSRRVVYESHDIPVSIPILHGGEIVVIGDVSGDDLLNMIRNSPSGVVMSTNISIDGNLLRESSEDVVGGIMTKILDIIYNTDDSEMLGFSLTFEEDTDVMTSERTIRGWKIESGVDEESDRSFLLVKKIHSLP